MLFYSFAKESLNFYSKSWFTKVQKIFGENYSAELSLVNLNVNNHPVVFWSCGRTVLYLDLPPSCSF